MAARLQVQAAEDAAVFAALDTITQPCERCGFSAIEFPLSRETNQHYTQEICDKLTVGKIMDL